MEIPLFANNCAILAKIPINEKSNCPSILNARQPSSRLIVLLGAFLVSQTKDNSSSVLAKNKNHFFKFKSS